MDPLDEAFARLLPIIEADLQTVLWPPDGVPPGLFTMMHYHMGWVEADGRPVAEQNSGKRLRPLLCLLVCEAVSGSADAARPVGAAIELIHNFSLLHDDIQDGSPTRRGKPAVWTVWEAKNAINAGDALFSLAFAAIPKLSSSGIDSASFGRQVEMLAKTCLELTRGQHLDMAFEKQDRVSVDEYLDMVAGKTAALISTSTQIGAMVGGAHDEQQALFAAFGHNLGMAFQIRDDMLDIWGEPAQIGKAAAQDIRDRKKSLPVLYAMGQSSEFRDMYQKAAAHNEHSIEEMIAWLEQLGAHAYAQELAQSYSEETERYLHLSQPGGVAGEALLRLVRVLLSRES